MSKPKKTKTPPPEERWAKIAQGYAKALPPTRPSIDDCKNYAKIITNILPNKKEANVLILGSSPRMRDIIRDLSLSNKINLFCLDVTPEMYNAMSILVWMPVPNEKYIEGSWVDLDKNFFKDNFFDLIIGEEVICNVDQEKHKQLFQGVVRVLKKTGVWVTRHNYLTDSLKKFNGSKLILDSSKQVLNGNIKIQQACNDLAIMFLFYYVALKNKNIASVKTGFKLYKEAEKKAKSKASKQEKMMIEKITKDFTKYFISTVSGHYWTLLTEEESESELKKHFEIKKKVFSNDYISTKFSPIYVLKPKK